MVKMWLRNLFLGTIGTLALAAASPINATELDDYLAMSQSETVQLLKEKAVNITDDNYQREIFDYDGAVILLVDSSCPSTEDVANHNRNMESVILKLQEQYEGVEVNNLPIKFTYLDGCVDNANTHTKAFRAVMDQQGAHTIMYLNGKEVDRLSGTPVDTEYAGAFFRNMSKYWIPLNLTDPNNEYTAKYEGGTESFDGNLHKIEK